MDYLKAIIDSLSEEDKQALALFIQRQKRKKSRKDLDLYKLLLLKQNYPTAALLGKLYPDGPNPGAYHALRKRLMAHIMHFVLLKRQENDPTMAASVWGLISLSGYLFERHADRLAWHLLRKAERLAEEHEQYEVLNSVYYLQLEHWRSGYPGGPGPLIAKWNHNKQRADEEERAAIASAWISFRLQEAKSKGEWLDFDQITAQVLAEYGLHHTLATRPKLLYQLLTIARSAVLVKKDYFSFEPYLIKQYQLLADTNGLFPHHRAYQVGLLYMVAQTLYRNRKFTASMTYLAQLNGLLTESAKSTFQSFYPRYVLLLAMNLLFTRQQAEAIQVLQRFLTEAGSEIANGYQLQARLNLAFCYFQQDDYRKANQLLLGMPHSDGWCQKKLGRQWVLKKALSELIIQYELGHVDLALNKIRSIERIYQDLLRQPAYANVHTYLRFVKKFIAQPTSVTEAAFGEEVSRSFQFLPIEQEDLQAINFYAWLKSKMVRRPYYDVLLELVAMGNQAGE